MSHMCYDARMATIASRELRNRTRQVLGLVEAGEDVTITVDGRPVGRIVPIARRPRWIARDVLFERLRRIQADAGLASDIGALARDTTDDLDAP